MTLSLFRSQYTSSVTQLYYSRRVIRLGLALALMPTPIWQFMTLVCMSKTLFVTNCLTCCCSLQSFDFSAGLCNVRPTSISVQFWVVEWLFALTLRSVPYQCDQYCPRSRIQPVAWRCLCGLSLTCPVRLYVHWLRIPYWINIDWLQLRRYFQSWYWTSGGEGLLWRVWPWMQLFLWVWYISQAAVVLLTRPMTKGTLVYQVLYTALSFMGPYSCVIYVLLPWMEVCAKQTLSWH